MEKWIIDYYDRLAEIPDRELGSTFTSKRWRKIRRRLRKLKKRSDLTRSDGFR